MGTFRFDARLEMEANNQWILALKFANAKVTEDYQI